MNNTQNTFTVDLKGQCYEAISIKDGEKMIEQYIRNIVSFYENFDETVEEEKEYEIIVNIKEKRND